MSEQELEFEVRLPALPELRPLVETFLLQVLDIAGFEDPERSELATRVLDLLVQVEIAADEGTGDGLRPIDLVAVVDRTHVRLSSHECGVPLDATTVVPAIDGIREVRWVQHESNSELRIAVERPRTSIAVLEAARDRATTTSSADRPSRDDLGDYRVRPYRAGDGIMVARTIYETYGRAYPNPDVYDPDLLDDLNRSGRMLTIVCESPGGDVAGTYALERPGLEAIGEAGQAVIDPAHRGRGLMRLMRTEVERIGRELRLHGIYSQPTTRHPLSQRMNIKFGSVPTALCLGTTPASATFRSAVDGGTDSGTDAGRHSCFLYWHPLRSESPVRAFVPESLARITEALYAARGRDVIIETAPPADLRSETSVCATHYDAARGVARISVDRIDRTSTAQIESATTALVAMPGVSTVFIDLPIDDPGTIDVASDLLGDGVRPAGIGPGFQTIGSTERPVEDVLRLQKSIAKVDLGGLVIEGETGEILHKAVLDPQWDR